MARIPLIVGFGGVCGAGRSSFHHGYRRLVIDALDASRKDKTFASLASLMRLQQESGGLTDAQRQYMLDHTLIRSIESDWFDVDDVQCNKRMTLNGADDKPISFVTRARDLPDRIPSNWTVSQLDNRRVRVDISGETQMMVPTSRTSTVQSAGQLPSGFDPGALYPARSHPRGLQLAVYGASDAVQSMGIDWEQVCALVPPDQISVYAGSAMGQQDTYGHGGMIGARYNNKRTTSKNCPLGLVEMPADFINAYVLGSAGNTGTFVGACATFLYNLRQAVHDIQNGIARVVVVGSSEAPLISDVIEGYAAMGALATAQEILALDANRNEPDFRRASRPFSSNCGFTIAESSQYFVLMDDELAMTLGANVHAAVTDVFVNADGHKKSISSPGIGNYITVGKTMAAARALLGEESLQQRSYFHAHGTSTPYNRVSESLIMNEAAKAYGIQNWPVAAIKAFLGHSLGVSGGDQLMAALGVWVDGFIPGISTIDHVAEDVHSSNLHISSEHYEVGQEGIDVSILNSKGFGGNNATAAIIGPHIARRMLQKRYGAAEYAAYQSRNEAVSASAEDYDSAMIRGEATTIYRFDHNVLDGDDIEFNDKRISVPGFGKSIDLDDTSPYADLL